MRRSGFDLIITGIGGQGVLVAGDFIARAFVAAGYDVKFSALRGIAQRGGAVVAHLRSGVKVHSPLVSEGKADVLVSFDPEEATRRMGYLKKDGKLFSLSRSRLQEMASCHSGGERPVFNKVAEKDPRGNIFSVEYEEVAKRIRDIRTTNVFMVGFLSHYLPLKRNGWLSAMAETFPQKLIRGNRDSFFAGIRYAREWAQRRKVFV